jgi:predicted NBD/HSP70 family sugar kinase
MARDTVGQRSETVRRANLSAIVRELHLRGALSRSELGLLTGLTRSAIRGLIGELVAAGLVTEVPSRPAGTPGRPSPLVRPEPDAASVLGLEINVDSLAAARVGFGGAIGDRVRVDRPRAHLAAEEIIGDLVELARPILAGLQHHGGLIGVGVAVAGIVRRGDGYVRLSPNLGWREVPLGDLVRSALDVGARLWVGNEADLAGLAEHRRGAAVGAGSVLHVTGEVGVGGNLIVDGRPVVGAAGYAGEVGHMPVNLSGARCGCGAIGCWETEIGERAMLARAGRSPDGGRAAVNEVIDAARNGEPAALEAMDAVGAWLGIGLAGLVNILNPAVVVLGGHFERIYPLVAQRVARELDARALRASREVVRLVPGVLGVDAPLLGAAELAFGPFLADPAARLGSRRQRAALASAS